MNGQTNIYLIGGWNRWSHRLSIGPLAMTPPGPSTAQVRVCARICARVSVSVCVCVYMCVYVYMCVCMHAWQGERYCLCECVPLCVCVFGVGSVCVGGFEMCLRARVCAWGWECAYV
jgi:hypothetical protein